MAGLTDLQRYLFDLEGYIVLEGVLSPDEVAHLNSVWDKQQLPPPGETVRSQRFGNEFLGWDGACRLLIDHDAVLPVMIELCGSTVRLDHAYGIVMAQGTSGLGLHGGGIPFDRSQYYVTENGRMHNGLCVVSWALVDSPPGQGGFCAVPGSHKGAFPRPAEVPGHAPGPPGPPPGGRRGDLHRGPHPRDPPLDRTVPAAPPAVQVQPGELGMGPQPLGPHRCAPPAHRPATAPRRSTLRRGSGRSQLSSAPGAFATML